MRYKFYELEPYIVPLALMNVRATLMRVGITTNLSRSDLESLCVLLGIRFDSDGDILMDDGEGGDK